MLSFRSLRSRVLLLLPPAMVLAFWVTSPFGRADFYALLGSSGSATVYTGPPPSVAGGRKVFHLGHSLVGRDMPSMLSQLSGPNHGYESQLGWGTSLKAHWEPDVEILGFDVENAHPRYRDAEDALASGAYDAFVLTEMVEIRASIRFFQSHAYLRRWIERAKAGNRDIEIFLYETWHPLDDKEGWLNRIDRDLDRYWDRAILSRALSAMPQEDRPPVYLIPAGQVLAAFVRRIEGGDVLPGIADRTDLFARTPEGQQDQIHFNDYGAYLVALTHYAVLYGKSPVGLPHDLVRADGTKMTPLSADAAALMQRVVWDVVEGSYVATQAN